MDGEEIFVEQKGPGIRRRHNTEKIINKRFHLAHDIMGWEEIKNKKNILNKYNLNCTCRMCKQGHERYNRGKEKAFEHWQEQNLDIDDWM